MVPNLEEVKYEITKYIQFTSKLICSDLNAAILFDIILDLLRLLLEVNIMLRFIYVSFAELWGTRNQPKTQNEKNIGHNGIRTTHLSIHKETPFTTRPSDRWQA